MFKRTSFFLAAALTLLALPGELRAQGCGPQNPGCIVPTAPAGTNTNQAASTAFVQQAISPFSVPGGTNGQIQYKNGSVFGGFTASGDATINTGTGVVTLNTVSTAKGGTGANNATNSANDILASNGANGTFIHTALLTVINSVCTLTPGPCASLFGYYSPFWYGAKCDNSTDDTTALNNTYAGAAGGKILIPAATCIVSNTINVTANTTLSGVNRNISVIKSTACLPILTISNISFITIENLWLRGTDACVSWPSGNFGAIFGATTSGSNWTFRSIRQSNFNSNYWNYIAQSSGFFTNLTLDDVLLDSTAADAPGGANNVNVGIQIQSGTLGSRIENTVINNVQVNGTDICLQLILYSNFQKFSVRNSRFMNAGGANTNGHCTNGLGATNAYGIAVYDLNNDGNPPQDGIIEGNYIQNSIAAGIYLVAGSTLTRAATTTPLLIIGNEISGQTHTDTALPRGAIAVNTSTDVTIVGNRLRNNAIGINSVAQTAGVLSAFANDCYSGAAASICLNLQAGSNGSSNTDQRVIRGNYFESGGNSVVMVSATGARFNNVDLSGNTIVADSASAGAGLSAASQWATGVFNLKDNTFFGPSSTAMVNIAGLTGSLGLMGNTFNTPAGVGGILFANLPAAVNGSQVFIQDGTAASSPCTGAGTGTTAMRQNGAWKCF